MALGRVIAPLVGDEEALADIVAAHGLSLGRYLAFCVFEGDLKESAVDEILAVAKQAAKGAFEEIKQVKATSGRVH